MSAARSAGTTPALTLVRPRRTGDSADDRSVQGAEAREHRSGPVLGTALETGDGALAEPVTARPLDPEDRRLLASMSPALATALVEVLVGSRIPTTIEKWVEGPLFERILAHVRVRESLSQRNPHVDRPHSTSEPRVCEVSDSVVEIALVVTTTRRPRALALRLTRRRSRWRLSDFVSI